MKFSCILFFGFVACAEPPPDYILDSGMGVYDPHHMSNKTELDVIVNLIIQLAPEAERPKILPFLSYGTLTIDPNKTLKEEQCGKADNEEEETVGCASGGGDILVAWRTCEDYYPTAGIMAHEIGHIIGYWDHTNPWFGEDYSKGNRKGSMEFKLWEEICGLDLP